MLELVRAELHNPLFVAGMNLGLKLEPAKKGGLKLFYDRTQRELLVTMKTPAREETAIVPISNVVSMIAGAVKESEVTKIEVPKERITAQVDSPMGHVFQGPGHGKTGKG